MISISLRTAVTPCPRHAASTTASRCSCVHTLPISVTALPSALTTTRLSVPPERTSGPAVPRDGELMLVAPRDAVARRSRPGLLAGAVVSDGARDPSLRSRIPRGFPGICGRICMVVRAAAGILSGRGDDSALRARTPDCGRRGRLGPVEGGASLGGPAGPADGGCGGGSDRLGLPGHLRLRVPVIPDVSVKELAQRAVGEAVAEVARSAGDVQIRPRMVEGDARGCCLMLQPGLSCW